MQETLGMKTKLEKATNLPNLFGACMVFFIPRLQYFRAFNTLKKRTAHLEMYFGVFFPRHKLNNVVRSDLHG
jgi:hypothetical protein